MTHYTAMIKINGVWRNLLIVESDTPIEYVDQKNITFYLGEESTTYYTEGLYQSYHQPDIHRYWFLYDEKLQSIKKELEETKTELAEADAALEIAIGGQEDEQD